MMAVKGDRVTPPMAPASPMRAQTPGVVPGRACPRIPPTAAPSIRTGARMPPLVPLPSPADQMSSFTTNSSSQGGEAELAQELGVDGAVADAERPRLHQAAEPDDEAADHRPPHPVQSPRQELECILEAVDGLGHQPGAQTGGEADGRRSEEDDAAERGVRRHREDRLGREQPGIGQDHAQAIGRGRRQADEHHGTRLPFEGQELDAEERGRHRGAEDGAHAGRRTRHEEGAALGRGEAEELADDGADGTAGQDDRSLCAEGAA